MPATHASPPAAPTTRLLLQRGQASRLPQARPARLCSAAGTLWITIDHDTRDIVLEPGQCLTVSESAAITVSALSPQAVLDLHAGGGARP